MKYIPLVVALFGVSISAQVPCNAGCLSNCPVDSRCPTTNELEATLLRHLSNCSKFIKCEYGHGCEQDCPAGLHFNEREKACDWPSNSCCDPSVPCGPPTADPPTTTCVANPECPTVHPLQPVLLPHEQCSKFLKCHLGNACEYDCPSGLHFNARELTCDWPWRACCDPAVPCDPCPTCPPPSDATTTTSMPTSPTPTTLKPTTSTPEPTTTTTPLPTTTTTAAPTPLPTPGDCTACQLNCELDTRCPATNIAKSNLIPNLAKCSEFFKCETGRACRMLCPRGLHFNQKTKVCDWPWNACCDPAVTCVKPRHTGSDLPVSGLSDNFAKSIHFIKN